MMMLNMPLNYIILRKMEKIEHKNCSINDENVYPNKKKSAFEKIHERACSLMPFVKIWTFTPQMLGVTPISQKC